jgi:hypothetical protein
MHHKTPSEFLETNSVLEASLSIENLILKNCSSMEVPENSKVTDNDTVNHMNNGNRHLHCKGNKCASHLTGEAFKTGQHLIANF